MKHLKLIPQEPSPIGLKLLETMAYYIEEEHTFPEWCALAHIEPLTGWLNVAEHLAYRYGVFIQKRQQPNGMCLFRLMGSVVQRYELYED